jgi:hypothetical protein
MWLIPEWCTVEKNGAEMKLFVLVSRIQRKIVLIKHVVR